MDDYLNALAVGSAFRAAADRLGISRARLAYVVDSTAAPVCVLVPASTWTVFIAGLLEQNGLAGAGGGTGLYVSLLPFLLYPLARPCCWCCCSSSARSRRSGPMAAAERAVRAGKRPVLAALDESLEPDRAAGPAARPGLRAPAFLLPILGLPAAALAFDGDALFGVAAAIGLALLLALLVRPGGGFGPVADGALLGMEKMVYPLGIVLVSFVLRDVNAALGLTEFAIGAVRPFASAWMLPALVFVVISGVAFATGSFWGAYAVSMPVVIGLTAEIGAPLPLTLGALVSARGLRLPRLLLRGASVLAAKSAGCSITEHVKTQFPYALIGAGLAFAGFVVIGLVWR